MSVRHFKNDLLARADIVAPPVTAEPAAEQWQDYNFELPSGLYVATAAMFAGFVSVLTLAFAHPEMAVPWGVIIGFIAAFFAVPTLLVRSAPEGCARSLCWSKFMQDGIMTATGRETGIGATVLVLLLPAAILTFGIAVAGIVLFLL